MLFIILLLYGRVKIGTAVGSKVLQIESVFFFIKFGALRLKLF